MLKYLCKKIDQNLLKDRFSYIYEKIYDNFKEIISIQTRFWLNFATPLPCLTSNQYSKENEQKNLINWY